jgi:hypothetical protein
MEGDMNAIDKQERERRFQARAERRAALDARERAAAGGLVHVGHLPMTGDVIEGWTFRRCRCGFTLGMTPAGDVWWLKAVEPALRIGALAGLLAALNTRCRFHQRQNPPAAPKPPAIAAPKRPPIARCRHGIAARSCAACVRLGKPSRREILR